MQWVVDVQVNHGAECSVGDDCQKELACTWLETLKSHSKARSISACISTAKH